MAPGQSAPSAPMPSEADLAAQVAQMNAEAMAEPVEAPEKPGGFFARFTRGREKTPEPPQPSGAGDAGFGDASMGDASMDDASLGDANLGDTHLGDASLGDANLGDASLGDASFGDASMDEGLAADAGLGEAAEPSIGNAGIGLDAGLGGQALPSEKPPGKKPSIVTIGWVVLGLVVASVVGTFALAPSAVTSMLPGAARLYGLFGVSVGPRGLAFEDIRSNWTSAGGQTVLQIEGNIVNHTSSTVAVPTISIALRDADGEEISAWSTEIGAEQLAGGERAPFLRQISSPPNNVDSVKVHFGKAE